MDFVRAKIPAPLDRTVIYSGTLGTLTGGFVFAGRFSASLTDPKLNRRLALTYDVRPLSYLTVE